jgi:hypothetical protein
MKHALGFAFSNEAQSHEFSRFIPASDCLHPSAHCTCRHNARSAHAGHAADAPASAAQDACPSSARSSATTWSCSAARRIRSGAGLNRATKFGPDWRTDSICRRRSRPALAGEDSAASRGRPVHRQDHRPRNRRASQRPGRRRLALRRPVEHGPAASFVRNGADEVKAANYPEIRFFTVRGTSCLPA